MPERRIVTVEDADPVLRRRARPVGRVDAAVRQLMDDMLATMRAAPGVGLAAPQVGMPLRVIVVEVPIEEADGEPADGQTRLRMLANPEIIWASEEQEEGQEACLSVPDLYGDVARSVAIQVRALNRAGRRETFEARGFEARVLQHEIDHLDGILFVDRVTSIEKLYRIEEEAPGRYVRVPLSVPCAGQTAAS